MDLAIFFFFHFLDFSPFATGDLKERKKAALRKNLARNGKIRNHGRK